MTQHLVRPLTLTLLAALSSCADAGRSPTADAAAPEDATPSGGDAGAAADDAAAPPRDAGVTPEDAGVVAPAGALTERAARAVCGALYRCCAGDDVSLYFAPYAASERLAAFRDRIPPRATLDEVGCRAVLREMLDVVPFGDWVREANAGRVGYDPAAADACAAALDASACGAPVRAALMDSECYAFAAPIGGLQARRMFQRTRGPGEDCAPLRDGVGASFYGTCDPTRAFCCYEDAARPGECTFPFAAQDRARAGRCAPAGEEGAVCATSLPLSLCRTGLDCGADDGRCAAPLGASLQVGEACVGQSFELLGDCVDAWCDVLGSGRCEAWRADGAPCADAAECRSGACLEGQCAEPTFCAQR